MNYLLAEDILCREAERSRNFEKMKSFGKLLVFYGIQKKKIDYDEGIHVSHTILDPNRSYLASFYFKGTTQKLL